MQTQSEPSYVIPFESQRNNQLFEWDPSYSVSVQLLDRHHQHLFGLVNGLHFAMLNQQGTAVLAATLEELVTYTRMHFVAEEVLMEAFSFPGYLQHRMEHERLTRTVTEFQSQFLSGQERLSVQLMEFLKSWLADHILGTDKKYSEFFAQRGAR